MKARIKEPRFVVGKELSIDQIRSKLRQFGLNDQQVDNQLAILCDNGLCVRSSENGYTMLATSEILSDMR